MLTVLDDTWKLENRLERRGFALPSGPPGVAVRLSLAAVAGTIASALKVMWGDAAGDHDFDTAKTITTGATLLLEPSDLQGVRTLSVVNPAVQSGVVVHLVASVETPTETPSQHPLTDAERPRAL